MVDLNAPVWKTLYSAGNDAEKWLGRLLSGEAEFREVMEILGEDLSHQLSWYSATAYVLPHLAVFCKKLSPEERMFLVGQIGPAIAAAESENGLPPDTEDFRELQEGLDGLRPLVQDLIRNHQDTLDAAGPEEQQMFALGALAVLGNRRHAYDLFLLSAYCWEEGHAACACGWNNECFPLGEKPGCLKPAGIAPWDGQFLADEAVWFSGLLSRFGDEEILPVLPLVYGTGTCPECGKEEPYWTWLDRFMEDY